MLEKGATYPPTTHGFLTLKRGGDWVQASIQTSGLPAGAYTVWWVIFDTPAGCVAGCDVDDLFNQDANLSVFRATGKVVQQSGVGNFRARHQAGESLGEPGTQHLLENGSLDPSRAEIHNVIKYHGPASDDRRTLALQTQTVLGGCLKGANAVDLGAPFGVQTSTRRSSPTGFPEDRDGVDGCSVAAASACKNERSGRPGVAGDVACRRTFADRHRREAAHARIRAGALAKWRLQVAHQDAAGLFEIAATLIAVSLTSFSLSVVNGPFSAIGGP